MQGSADTETTNELGGVQPERNGIRFRWTESGVARASSMLNKQS
jgi:hypothetical protein